MPLPCLTRWVVSQEMPFPGSVRCKEELASEKAGVQSHHMKALGVNASAGSEARP